MEDEGAVGARRPLAARRIPNRPSVRASSESHREKRDDGQTAAGSKRVAHAGHGAKQWGPLKSRWGRRTIPARGKVGGGVGQHGLPHLLRYRGDKAGPVEQPAAAGRAGSVPRGGHQGQDRRHLAFAAENSARRRLVGSISGNPQFAGTVCGIRVAGFWVRSRSGQCPRCRLPIGSKAEMELAFLTATRCWAENAADCGAQAENSGADAAFVGSISRNPQLPLRESRGQGSGLATRSRKTRRTRRSWGPLWQELASQVWVLTQRSCILHVSAAHTPIFPEEGFHLFAPWAPRPLPSHIPGLPSAASMPFWPGSAAALLPSGGTDDASALPYFRENRNHPGCPLYHTPSLCFLSGLEGVGETSPTSEARLRLDRWRTTPP